MRNALLLAPTRRKRATISSALSAVFGKRDPQLVRELYHLTCDAVGRICPKAAKLLEDAEG